jgi:hypothetical protein
MYLSSVAKSCASWKNLPLTLTTSCIIKQHKSSTMCRNCFSWSWIRCCSGWICNYWIHGKIN